MKRKTKTINKRNKLKVSILLIAISALVSGCANMNADFDCGMKPGVRCESLDSVNARIDRGGVEHDDKSFSTLNIKHSSARILTTAATSQLMQHPLRHGETVQRIWVAPFEDKEGNYHHASEVDVVIAPGAWLGAPVTEWKGEE